MIRVFIADDSSVIRTAVRRLLDSEPDMEVIGEASNYSEVTTLLASHNPNVLICDLRMPSSPHFEPAAVAQLAAACKCVVVAVSFAEIDVELEARARQLGASHVLDKTRLFEQLAPAIRQAVQMGTSPLTI